HRAHEAGRPAGREQLLRVSAVPLGTGGRQLDVEAPVRGAGRAVSAPRRVRLRGVQHFLDLVHGTLLSRFSTLPSAYPAVIATARATGPRFTNSKRWPADRARAK